MKAPFTSVTGSTYLKAPLRMVKVGSCGVHRFAVLGPVRRIKSEEANGAFAARLSGVWCVRLQGGGGRQGGALATDDNAAGGTSHALQAVGERVPDPASPA
ncbi:hypothetical protein SHKM778_28400 [Streptomyces sp. KM77-8]|uniref:Uncharacterized protein n=1 Tax=Streptomyces haneummycinicus TaxID=3074435 RepID=A0AAT9HGF5_9ACTN